MDETSNINMIMLLLLINLEQGPLTQKTSATSRMYQVLTRNSMRFAATFQIFLFDYSQKRCKHTF